MPPSKLNEISNAAQRQNIRINPDKPQDDFYFYYTIDIGNGQKKKSNLIKANINLIKEVFLFLNNLIFKYY